ALLSVGSGDLFQVNTLGNLTFNSTNPTVTFGAAGGGGSLAFKDGGSNTLFNMVDSTSTLSTLVVGLQGTTNGEIRFGNTAGLTAPTISASSSGDLWVQAPAGTTIIGSGTGNIVLQPSSTGIVNVNLGNSGATGDFTVQVNGSTFNTFSHNGN